MCAGVGTAALVASTLPAESRAWTANAAAALRSEIRWLTPRARAEATAVSAVGVDPASTCQEATPLAPAQLTYSAVVPLAAGETLSDGGVGGGAALVTVPDVSAVSPSTKSLSMLIVDPL